MAKNLSLTHRKPLRHKFGVLLDSAEMPNLIEIQKFSYQQFLNSETKDEEKMSSPSPARPNNRLFLTIC